MIMSSFKSVGWVAGVGAAALGCYMLSLQVAAERADLAGVERRIVATHQAIRNLQTELGTRGRLQQLESWNAEVLALSAPAAGQFVENELLLARFETRATTDLGGGAPVRMASAEVAPPPASQAQPQAAATVRQAVASTAPAADRESAPPMVRRASLITAPASAATPRTEPKPSPTRTAAAPPRPATTPTRTAAAAPRPATSPARTPAARQPSPVRAAALINERTARELGETARTEGRRPAEAPARDRQPSARN